jgi:hypothetical protein
MKLSWVGVHGVVAQAAWIYLSAPGWSGVKNAGCEDHSSQTILTSSEAPMDLQLTACPECGGTATLLHLREDFEEVPDLGRPMEKARIPVKIEEFRCQEQSCEHEFERIVREPAT